jgi:hypothetical protein
MVGQFRIASAPRREAERQIGADHPWQRNPVTGRPQPVEHRPDIDFVADWEIAGDHGIRRNRNICQESIGQLRPGSRVRFSRRGASGPGGVPHFRFFRPKRGHPRQSASKTGLGGAT